MKHRILLVLSAAVFLPPASGADCIIECMERSGCWHGRSISDPHGCNVQPQLCQIQCEGHANNRWGAIAYSRRDRIAGWSHGQSSRAAAERTALQYCTKQGGAGCRVEASFFNLCGAVAADGEHVGWGTAGAKMGAEQRALAECAKAGGRKCAVEAWVCASTETSPAPRSAPPPPRQTSWGAIAYSTRDMGAGWSRGKDDRASAEKEAMSLCSQRGKACVLRTAFNKQCGALAADRDFTGWAVSADQREAQQKAVAECARAGGARCALHIAFCSF
jgi:hypothetical protein